MKINKLLFKNFASYGNRIQEIEFNKEQSDLYLVLGGNGAGKCLDKETKLVIDIEDEEIKKQFLEFLERKTIST
jgi:ABC-type uncharacterized transport system ATPase component